MACLSSQAGCGWTAIQWCVRIGFGSACVFFSTRSVSSCAASFNAAFFAGAPARRTMVLFMSARSRVTTGVRSCVRVLKVLEPSALPGPSEWHTIASYIQHMGVRR